MRTSLQNRNEQTIAPNPLCISISSKRHNRRPIHFLKIDGHEETVLRGMDFTQWRPWIILIETPWERDQTWETLVTGAGYQSILFDGINTYYLAEEHLALKPAFNIPPCNLDEFQFCRGHNFSHPITDAENHLAAALQRAEAQLLQCKTAGPGKPFRNSRKPCFAPDQKPA